MENKLFLFVFFEKEDFLVFDCWGEAVIGKKKRAGTVGFMLGNAYVQDGMGARRSLSLFSCYFFFEEVLNWTLRVP